MYKFSALLAACVMLPAFLCSCAPFGFGDHRAGVCNEMNSKIIFNGGTSNTRAAEIQNAEDPLLQHSYRKCS